jgi:hypothetical protein
MSGRICLLRPCRRYQTETVCTPDEKIGIEVTVRLHLRLRVSGNRVLGSPLRRGVHLIYGALNLRVFELRPTCEVVVNGDRAAKSRVSQRSVEMPPSITTSRYCGAQTDWE